MGRGSTLVFGKITLSSESESIKTLVEYLDTILANYNYPSDDYGKKEEDEAPFSKKAVEQAEADVKAMISKVKPANDSVILLEKEAAEEEMVVAEDALESNEEELEDELDDPDGEEEDALGRPDDSA